MNQTTNETHYNYDYRADNCYGITQTLPKETKIFDKSRLNNCKTIDKIVEKVCQQRLKNNWSWQDITTDDDDQQSDSDDNSALVIIKNMFQMIKERN